MIMLGYFNPPGLLVDGRGQHGRPGGPRRSRRPTATPRRGASPGIYDGLLRPGRLLSAELLAEATSPQSEGLLPRAGGGGHLRTGLQARPPPRRPFGPNRGSFGHFGTGGAVGFADPEAGVAFGYVMNHVIPRWQSSRNRALIDAALRGALSGRARTCVRPEQSPAPA